MKNKTFLSIIIIALFLPACSKIKTSKFLGTKKAPTTQLGKVEAIASNCSSIDLNLKVHMKKRIPFKIKLLLKDLSENLNNAKPLLNSEENKELDIIISDVDKALVDFKKSENYRWLKRTRNKEFLKIKKVFNKALDRIEKEKPEKNKPEENKPQEKKLEKKKSEEKIKKGV